MKAVCTQENLSKGLNIAARLTEKTPNLPILNNVLFKAQKDGLVILSTNLEIGIKTKIRGKIDIEGEFTVPSRLISEFINSLRKENIELERNELILTVRGENHQTSIKGLDAADFPVIPDIEAKRLFMVSADALRGALAQTAFAMSSDESRPELCGAYFQCKGKTCTIATTDSYRLAEKNLPLTGKHHEDTNVIVPARTIHEVARILDLEDATEVEIKVSENQICFSFGSSEVVSRVIVGDYPDYQQIIPKSFKNEVEFSISEMVGAIKTTSLFCKQGINDVRISLEKRFDTITVQAENATFGKNVSNVNSHSKNQEMDIVFNYKFFLDSLQHTEADTAILKTNDATSPALLTSKKGSDYLCIIMPIRQ